MESRLALVTGATGLIGRAIAKLLVDEGRKVRAIVRDQARAETVVPIGVELVRGDVTDPASLGAALRDVDVVFHAAGMPEQWQADERVFDRVNRVGTVNVLEAALAAEVRRVVYTSTMDVFAAPRGGTLVETNIDPDPKPTAYERSKQAAEREAETIRARGLDLVYVNPSAVYGPSPVHVGMNDFFIQLLNGKMPLVPPGGVSLVFVEECARAHVAAAERGVNGARYLLADAHVSTTELATLTLAAAGSSKSPPATAPAWLLRALATVSAPVARVFGVKPLIAPGQLSFLLWDAHVDATKAQRELGYTPRAVRAGLEATIAALRADRLVP